MNIEQANAIPLSEILEKLGFQPVKRKGNELWYYSPLRHEKTPSFHVKTNKNIWFDFGTDQGGKVIDFVCLYLQSQGDCHTLVDALRWLENMLPSPQFEIFEKEETEDVEPAIEVRRTSSIQSPYLIDYLHSRAISHGVAKKFLREAQVFNKETGQTFHALALRNENGGFELRNNLFKGSVAPKTVSVIRGSRLLPDVMHVFEGMFDYLSALIIGNIQQFSGDTIILNSINCLPLAMPYIKNYSYKTVCPWFDNDAAGVRATTALKDVFAQQSEIVIKPMNDFYAPFKDVNDFLVGNPPIKKLSV